LASGQIWTKNTTTTPVHWITLRLLVLVVGGAVG
jgi:hypothetical protein